MWSLAVLWAAAAAVSATFLVRFGAGMSDPLGTGQAEPGSAVAFVLLVVIYLAVGGVEWLRGYRRDGTALVVIAVMLATGTLVASRVPLAFTAGSIVVALLLPVFAYVMLTYPDRVRLDRTERLAVVLAVIGAVTVMPVHLFYAPELHGCPTCPRGLNVLLWRPDSRLLALTLAAGSVPTVAGLVALAVAAVRRFRAAAPVARRILGPMAGVTVAYAVAMVTFLVIQGAERSEFGPPQAKAGLAGVAFLVTVAAMPIALLVARARERAAAGLLQDLTAVEGGLETTLRRLIGDPHLRLAYADGQGGYRSEGGEPITLPPTGDDRVVTALGDDIGALVHDRALLREPKLLAPLTAVTSLAVHNELLARQVAAQLEEVRASRARIVEASDSARRQVERDLHDGAQQRLVTAGLRLQSLRSALTTHAPALCDRLDEATVELAAAVDELRSLARGVYPEALRTGGLPAALDNLATFAAVPVVLDVRVDRRLPPPVEAAAYFTASEAITNVAKHAGGPAHVRVVEDGAWLAVTVSDQGPGGADPHGSGLRGLADRVAALGGHLHVASDQPRGTVVHARLPVARP